MEIVLFDLAQKLEEKGYPQHWSNDDYIVENEYEDNFEVGCYYDRCLIPEHIATIAAPSISQVLKWLREEKKIHINICFYGDKIGNYEYTYWNYEIINIHNGKIIYKFDNKQCMLEFECYEEVAITGIKYVLDNLI